MSEQKEYCQRCHGSGRVGYVMEDGRRGHTKCPGCQGSCFKASEPSTIPKVNPDPPNAPRGSNAQEGVPWERSRPGFLWGNPVPFPTARPKEWFKMAEDLLNQTEDEYHRDREFEEGWAAWL